MLRLLGGPIPIMEFSAALLHTLGLSNGELRAVLDRPESTATVGCCRRRDVRQPFHFSEGIVVDFLERGIARDCARVAPSNISSNGIAFVHRGSLPEGTHIALNVPDSPSSTKEIRGRVVRCSSVGKSVHEIGVVFDATADVGLLMNR